MHVFVFVHGLLSRNFTPAVAVGLAVGLKSLCESNARINKLAVPGGGGCVKFRVSGWGGLCKLYRGGAGFQKTCLACQYWPAHAIRWK